MFDVGCLMFDLGASPRLRGKRGPVSRSVREGGFTLVELLVSMGVLVLLVFLATQLLNSAATITILGHKQMDADSQARQVLDRMTIDFAQMVKRSDVDYYLKSSAVTPLRNVLQPGNDQIAFYSTVPGYYPSTGLQSPVSIVAYRVNSDSSSSAYSKLQRMGKGLLWSGSTPASGTPPPGVVFIPVPMASPLSMGDLRTQTPTPTPTPAGSPAWPQAGNMTADPDYELIGPQVFRFEYYYLLKGQVVNGTTYNPIFTDTPWDTRIPGHIGVSGMGDVAAIIADIAVIDPKSKVLLSDSTSPPQIAQVAAQLIDWGTTCDGCQWQTTPGLLRAQWQNALDRITNLPRPAISGIRLYERYFYLSSPPLSSPTPTPGS